MPITPPELARRLRVAREACRLTQEQVAERLGVPRASVVQMEAGNRSVSSLELDKLAFLFGRDIAEFVATSFQDEDTLAVLFRADAEVSQQPAVADALRSCIALGRELTNLERLLGIDRDIAAVASYPQPAPNSRWDAIQQGQRVADDERRRLGVGVAPLPALEELLEGQGIRTGLVDLPDDVSGLTLCDREAGLFVVANRAHHHLRRRFSFAHEYAHVLADRARGGLVSRAAERSDLLEVRANAFAASFLMSEDGVRQVIAGLGKGKPSRGYAEVFDEVESLDVEGRTPPDSQTIQLYDVVRVAHHFGVSRLSTLYRLRNLKLVTKAEFDKLRALDDAGKGKQTAEQLGLLEPDHTTIRDEFHDRFLSLALEAYRRDEISKSKLRELGAKLGRKAREVDQLVEDAGLGNERPPTPRR